MPKKTPTSELKTIATKDLAAGLERRFKASQKNQRNAAGVAAILKSLSTIVEGKSRGIVDVQLEVPKAIAGGIKSKKLIRAGGTVRNAHNKQFVKHLSEIRPSRVVKLRKAAMLPLLVLDAAEKALVDQKLIKIQEVVEGVDRKLSAQIEARLMTALQFVKDASMAGTQQRRSKKLEDAQKEFRHAEKTYEALYRALWEKDFPELKLRYMKAKLRNGGERTKLTELASDMVSHLQIMVACKQTHLQLTLEMGDLLGAENEAIDLESFLLREEHHLAGQFGPRTFLHVKSNTRSLRSRLGLPTAGIRESTKEQLRLPLETVAFLRNAAICHHLSLPAPGDPNEESSSSRNQRPSEDSEGDRIGSPSI